MTAVGKTIVLIETSVLISASLHLDNKFQSKFYDWSKSIMNLIENNLTKQLGWTTQLITKQARHKIDDATEDTILETEKEKIQLKRTNPTEYFNLLSTFRNNSRDRLEKNIKILTIMPINEKTVNEILTNEINPFFKEVEKTLEFSTNKPFIQGFKLPWGLRKEITRRNRPGYKNIPDRSDLEILAEATYLKRTYLKESTLLIASTDTHFSPSQKDSIIRDKIKTAFEVHCDWPEKIYEILKIKYPLK